MLHTLYSNLRPLQGFPPCLGDGLEQDRDRLIDPPPQLDEQIDQSLHSENFPSIAQGNELQF